MFDDRSEAVAFFAVVLIVYVVLSLSTVPIHEYGHCSIARFQGLNTLGVHWGADTKEWIEELYPGASVDGVMPLGVCMIDGHISDAELQVHEVYDYIWIVFVVWMSLFIAYVPNTYLRDDKDEDTSCT